MADPDVDAAHEAEDRHFRRNFEPHPPQEGGLYSGRSRDMLTRYTSAPLARRPVYFDPWWPASREGQGAAIYPVLGDPGAGRSTLGLRVIQECILAGGRAASTTTPT